MNDHGFWRGRRSNGHKNEMYLVFQGTYCPVGQKMITKGLPEMIQNNNIPSLLKQSPCSMDTQ